MGERREKRRQGEVEGRKKRRSREREMVMETNRKDDSVIKKKRAVKTYEMKVCGLATAKVTMLNTVGVRDPLHCEVSSSSLTALQVY